MRVIAGSPKGRRLRTLEGLKIRPTSDRLRETLFNVLAPRMDGSRFLDLCAGSGAIGIEAISRGAAEVVFVEGSRRAAALIEGNLEHCGVTSGARVVNREVLSGLRFLAARELQFDIAYFDPPYDSQLYSPVLNAISEVDLVVEGGLVIVEHRGRALLAPNYEELRPFREIVQGDSRLTFYCWVNLNCKLCKDCND